MRGEAEVGPFNSPTLGKSPISARSGVAPNVVDWLRNGVRFMVTNPGEYVMSLTTVEWRASLQIESFVGLEELRRSFREAGISSFFGEECGIPEDDTCLCWSPFSRLRGCGDRGKHGKTTREEKKTVPEFLQVFKPFVLCKDKDTGTRRVSNRIPGGTMPLEISCRRRRLDQFDKHSNSYNKSLHKDLVADQTFFQALLPHIVIFITSIVMHS